MPLLKERKYTSKTLICTLEITLNFHLNISCVSIQNWNYAMDNPSDLFYDFFWRLEGYVDRHAPIKK